MTKQIGQPFYKTISKMASMKDQVELVSVGVDAYSAIFRGHPLNQRGLEIVKNMETLLNTREMKSRPYQNHGYSGFINEALAYGVKGIATYLASTGMPAVELEKLCRPFFPDVTRVDIQATFQFTFTDEYLIQEFYEEQVRLKKIKARHPEPKMISSATGDTLYLGKRGGTMARIYDKGRDYSVDPGRIFRFEVEYRDDQAYNVAHALGRVPDTQDLILRKLFDHFYQFAIRLPIEYGGKAEIMNVAPIDKGHSAYLEWARRVVGPTMRTLSGFNEGVALLNELGIQPILFDERDGVQGVTDVSMEMPDIGDVEG